MRERDVLRLVALAEARVQLREGLRELVARYPRLRGSAEGVDDVLRAAGVDEGCDGAQVPRGDA